MDFDPSNNPVAKPLFSERSESEIQKSKCTPVVLSVQEGRGRLVGVCNCDGDKQSWHMYLL